MVFNQTAYISSLCSVNLTQAVLNSGEVITTYIQPIYLWSLIILAAVPLVVMLALLMLGLVRSSDGFLILLFSIIAAEGITIFLIIGFNLIPVYTSLPIT